MKVGFTGTGGVGKTTVMQRVCESGKFAGHIQPLPSVMAEVIARHGIQSEQSLETFPPEKLRKFQLDGFFTRVNQENMWSKKSYLADRTLLDHFAYIISWCGVAWVDDILSSSLLNQIHKSLGQYDAIFYFPMRVFHNPSSEKRISRTLYHEMVDQVIYSFLKTHNITHFTVGTDSLTGRVSMVETVIQRVIHGQNTP